MSAANWYALRDDPAKREKVDGYTERQVRLPEDIYRCFQDMAAATHRPLEQILVEAIRGNLPPILDDVPAEHRDLVADLQHLDDEALWTIAKADLPAAQWRRHQRLLRKAEPGTLSQAEQAELTELRLATDRVVIRRSYALALLK